MKSDHAFGPKPLCVKLNVVKWKPTNTQSMKCFFGSTTKEPSTQSNVTSHHYVKRACHECTAERAQPFRAQVKPFLKPLSPRYVISRIHKFNPLVTLFPLQRCASLRTLVFIGGIYENVGIWTRDRSNTIFKVTQLCEKDLSRVRSGTYQTLRSPGETFVSPFL